MQEELDLKPGHSFLDVGSGCGIITACAAYLVRRCMPSSVSEISRNVSECHGDSAQRRTNAEDLYALMLLVHTIARSAALSGQLQRMDRILGVRKPFHQPGTQKDASVLHAQWSQ